MGSRTRGSGHLGDSDGRYYAVLRARAEIPTDPLFAGTTLTRNSVGPYASSYAALTRLK